MTESAIGVNREQREKRQQVFDINEKKLVPYVFPDGGQKQIYGNFNFSIFIDDKCDARCPFCVAELRYQERGKKYKKRKIFNNDEDYFKRLREILELVRPLNPSVSITGGEPTISPRLPHIARMLQEYDFRKKVVTTNGSGLFRKMPGEKQSTIDTLMETEFDHMNISRAHWDETLNNEIMLFKTKRNIPNDNILKVQEYLKGSTVKTRLSCVLTKKGIHTVQDMKDYVRYFNESSGFDNFIFRELMYHDRKSVNQSIIEWSDNERVLLNDLWKQIDGDDDFSEVLSVLGYYYYVEIWKLFGNTIAMESSNLEQHYVEKDSHKNIVYETVFHENGNLTSSWIDNEEILSKYS